MHLRKRALATATVAIATAVTGMGLSEVRAQGRPPTSVTRTNVVVDWNENAGQAAVAACFLGGYGPQEARMYAMMHLAVHDALNAIAPRSEPYAAHLSPRSGASTAAATAAASRDVLVTTLQSFDFFLPEGCIVAGVQSVEDDYAAALADIADSSAKSSGLSLGREAAAAVLAMRASDGYDTMLTDPAYVEGTAPGEYRYTPGTPFAFAPHLGEDLMPFALESGSQFLPGPPYSVTSAEYAADVNEVQSLGGDGITTPSARTADQTEIARFFLESSPLMWNRIAREAAETRHLDAWESTRLFGLLNMALTDGYVGSFKAKYLYRFWRPITAIRLADIDGNDATTADPTWTPLVETPPIPDYDSGHAVEGGAAAQVLRRFFHTDKMAFSTCSYTLPAGETCADPTPTIRAFTRFSEAETENAMSRIYVGYHFRDAVVTGTRHGQEIADYTVDTVLRHTHS
jgi:hypothetical protein